MGAVGVTLKDRALDYFYITLGIFNSLGPIYSFTMINQTTSGLERQIGPFSGPYLDIGPDRDQVPKSGLHRKHCMNSLHNELLIKYYSLVIKPCRCLGKCLHH